MAELFRVAGQIAGIGGLSLAVLLLVFRGVLAKRIFPQLTKQQAYKTIRLIVILTFFIGFLGIVSWVTVTVVTKRNTVQHSRLPIPEVVVGKTPTSGALVTLTFDATRIPAGARLGVEVAHDEAFSRRWDKQDLTDWKDGRSILQIREEAPEGWIRLTGVDANGQPIPMSEGKRFVVE